MCGISDFVTASAYPPDPRHNPPHSMIAAPTRATSGLMQTPVSRLATDRLSILDLSPAGVQPMHSKCGRYVMVFNGEIDNFARSRTDLESKGAFRRSR